MSLSNKVKSFFQAVMKPSPAAISQAFKVFKALSLTPSTIPTTSTPVLIHSSTPLNIRWSHAQSLKPHVPLIKFRKGSGTSHHGGAASSVPSSSPAVSAAAYRAPSTPLKQNEAYQLPSIEDWQLPSRFQRRPLDEEEIAFINRGGPDKL